MEIVNDCVTDGTLKFQVGDTCMTPTELITACKDNVEVLELLNKLIEGQRNLCKTRTIIKEVPVQVVKYIEFETTKYVKVKSNEPTPQPVRKKKKITEKRPPSINKPTYGRPVEGAPGWFYSYSNEGIVYRHEDGKITDFKTEEFLRKLFPNFVRPLTITETIGKLTPKPQSTYRTHTGTYGGIHRDVPKIFR